MALAAVAGYVFMEMAARITIVSGHSLGHHLRQRGRYLPALIFAAVLFGCTAYQAGNLVGALGGLQLLFPGVSRLWLLPLAGAVVALLWSGNTRRVARWLAFLVAGMGVLFLIAAVRIATGGTAGELVLPTRSSLILGLIGTTIVPYNFFLAAGLGSGSSLEDMRRGLSLSFGIGSLITAAILVVGTAAVTFLSFADLSLTIDGVLGSYGTLVLAMGLFAAGFSSSATAPLAAAIAARELLDKELRTSWFRGIWLGVLLTGLLIGFFELDIIGLILAAQVINGLLLPIIAATVLYLANQQDLLGAQTNSKWQNGAGTLVLAFLVFKALQFLGSLF